jgi:hypothetical protein
MKIVRFVTQQDDIRAQLDAMPRAPPPPPRRLEPITVGLLQHQLELPLP